MLSEAKTKERDPASRKTMSSLSTVPLRNACNSSEYRYTSTCVRRKGAKDSVNRKLYFLVLLKLLIFFNNKK